MDDEIKTLPEGTLLIIIWSGGNGPHEYVLTFFKGIPYAMIDDKYHLTQQQRIVQSGNLDYFIGNKAPFTMVRKA